jgi:hypothetical protein
LCGSNEVLPRKETLEPCVLFFFVVSGNSNLLEPFGCADKPAEKHCWLICCERKILFRLKKQAEKDGL